MTKILGEKLQTFKLVSYCLNLLLNKSLHLYSFLQCEAADAFSPKLYQIASLFPPGL